MSTHTGPLRPPDPSRCSWTWHWEDVDIDCDEPAVPGSRSCTDHLIARHAPRRFRTRVVHIEDV